MNALPREIQNRTEVNFSIERAITIAEEIISGRIDHTISGREIRDLANGVLALHAQLKQSRKKDQIEKKKPGRICEVCNTNEAAIICSIPMVPVSCAYCSSCFDANAHPWATLVANTACMDGLERTNEDWKNMVKDTCRHLGRTIEEFNNQVEQEIKDMSKAWEAKGQNR